MANIKHTHPDGRVCTYDADDHSWFFATEPNRFLAQCSLDHKFTERIDDDVQPTKTDGDNDRGDFGMPILGISNIDDYIQQDMVKYDLPYHPGNNPRFTPHMPDFKMMVEQDLIHIDYGKDGVTVHAQTLEARIILTKVLPGLLKMFLEKNTKYAEVQKGYDLGDKGIIPDLNRKLGILKARLWDGAPEVGEPTDEVIDDMIGHLLLMRAKRYGS